MASIAAKAGIRIRGVAVDARQVWYAWLIGSVTMGTVVALFLSFRPPAQGSSGQSIQSILPGAPGASDAIVPLAGLPVLARTAVIFLGVMLFAALAVLAWYTSRDSWLPAGTRGWVLWMLLVGVAGLAGWLFAATVTFGANFGPTVQLVLGFAGGGLPFALAAAMLLRSWMINLAAAGISAALVVAGFLLVASRSEYEPNALILYFDYIRYLFSSTPGLPGNPIIFPTGGLPTVSG